MATSLAGCLWYRAVEVPDVGEPFDVEVFLATLPSTLENQAGRLLRSAANEMEQSQNQVAQSCGCPHRWTLLFQTGCHFVLLQQVGPKRMKQKSAVGWNLLFQGEWAKKAQKAAELPQGMVCDPRLADLASVRQQAYSFRVYPRLGGLFVARALQLQARGDSRAGLGHLETVLALSRQVKNYASGVLLDCAIQMENAALAGMQRWLQEVGPDKEQIQAARTILERHKKDRPDPANAIKANFVINRNNGQPSFSGPMRLGELMDIAYGVPWEQQRQDRIVRALVLGQLRAMEEGADKHSGYLRHLGRADADRLPLIAAMNGLPPKDGPGSNLSARQWGEYLGECWFSQAPLGVYRWGTPALPATEIIIALALYQADRRGLPAKLEETCPGLSCRVANRSVNGQATPLWNIRRRENRPPLWCVDAAARASVHFERG